MPNSATVCQKCKEGFYKSEASICMELPLFCDLYDVPKKTCQRCKQNSIFRKGLCYDIFCQYFSSTAECLGCKTGYQYGSRGECVPERLDPNCK